MRYWLKAAAEPEGAIAADAENGRGRVGVRSTDPAPSAANAGRRPTWREIALRGPSEPAGVNPGTRTREVVVLHQVDDRARELHAALSRRLDRVREVGIVVEEHPQVYQRYAAPGCLSRNYIGQNRQAVFAMRRSSGSGNRAS